MCTEVHFHRSCPKSEYPGGLRAQEDDCVIQLVTSSPLISCQLYVNLKEKWRIK